jgi:hypothetical protein
MPKRTLRDRARAIERPGTHVVSHYPLDAVRRDSLMWFPERACFRCFYSSRGIASTCRIDRPFTRKITISAMFVA